MIHEAAGLYMLVVDGASEPLLRLGTRKRSRIRLLQQLFAHNKLKPLS